MLDQAVPYGLGGCIDTGVYLNIVRSAAMAPTPQVVGVRPRILCVDDDPDVRRVLRYALEDAGFAVAACGSGEATLAWIERHGLPDLAVVDAGLPGADGVELCRRIREHGDLPAILLTAAHGEPAPAEVLGTVAAGFMVKPFRPAELVARVRRTLRRATGRAV